MTKRDLPTGGIIKPPYIIEDHVLSYTAKYWGFFGSHYHEGRKCYVTGAVNTEDGVTTTRHYNERMCTNEQLAKYAATEAWEELKEGLSRKPSDEERETDERLLEVWEESARRSKELTASRRRLN